MRSDKVFRDIETGKYHMIQNRESQETLTDAIFQIILTKSGSSFREVT